MYGENIPDANGDLADDEFDSDPGNEANFISEDQDPRIFSPRYRGMSASEALAYERDLLIADSTLPFNDGADDPTDSPSSNSNANAHSSPTSDGPAQFSPIVEAPESGDHNSDSSPIRAKRNTRGWRNAAAVLDSSSADDTSPGSNVDSSFAGMCI